MLHRKINTMEPYGMKKMSITKTCASKIELNSILSNSILVFPIKS